MKQSVWRLAFWLTWPLVWVYSPLRARARLLVVCGNEFLAVKAYFGSGTWQLPGGGIRYREEPLAAALRELREETHIVLDPKHVSELVPLTMYTENGIPKRYLTFVATIDSKQAIRVPDREIVDAAWLPITDAPKNYAPHLVHALKQLQGDMHLLK